jgi:hypothetical protein
MMSSSAESACIHNPQLLLLPLLLQVGGVLDASEGEEEDDDDFSGEYAAAIGPGFNYCVDHHPQLGSVAE